MWTFLRQLFDTTDFPARWHCGTWTDGHGWLHIGSDLAIFGAYAAIPCVLLYFAHKRRDVPFQPIFWLFAAFILSCGLTHLIEATIFWHPWYRLSGVMKLITALASWGTVLALFPILPRALALPGLPAVNARLQREVAERQAVERRLRDTLVELERSNTELEQFAAVASHDLREPLRMVSGFMGLLRSQYGDRLDEKGLGFVDFAEDGARRLDAMIQGLLTYARVGSRTLAAEPVDLTRVVRLAERNVSVAMAEADAQLEVGELPLVRGDEGLLVQLFQNLLGNAVKFRGDDPPRVSVRARADGDRWRIEVEDNGLGIEPADRVRVLQLFQRGSSGAQRPGSGIGLSVCARIAQRHGGELTLDQAPAGGTLVVLTLPRPEAAPIERASQAPADAPDIG